MGNFSEHIREQGRIRSLVLELQATPRKCLTPKCQNDAIKSHHIQLNGVLSNIAEDGMIREWAPQIPFAKHLFELKSAKKSSMMAFYGFCKKCDKDIFASIEALDSDFTSTNNQLLLSYRNASNEERKLEWLCDFLSIVTSNEFKINQKLKNEYKEKVPNFLNRLESIRYFINKIGSVLFSARPYADSNLEASYKLLTKYDLAASGCISIGYHEKTSFYDKENISLFSLCKYCAINIVPRVACMELIIVWDKGLEPNPILPIHDFTSFSDSQALNFISDRLVAGIENFAISPKYYNYLLGKGIIGRFQRYKMMGIESAIKQITSGYQEDALEIYEVYRREEFNFFA